MDWSFTDWQEGQTELVIGESILLFIHDCNLNLRASIALAPASPANEPNSFASVVSEEC